MFCHVCGKSLEDGTKFCTGCGTALDDSATNQFTAPSTASSSQGMNFDFDTNIGTAVSTVRYEYKVLSQKDKWFSGKFDPALLEQAMNAYAQQGWRVIGCATADIAGFGTTRQEFVTIMEREVK